MDLIQTKDIFRAAYHITRKDYLFSISFNEDCEKVFTIKGNNLLVEDLDYSTGRALIDPLVFEKSYCFLNDVKERNLPPFHIFGTLEKDSGGELEMQGGME